MGVVELNKAGYSNKQIAEMLDIKVKSVQYSINKHGLKSNRNDLLDFKQDIKDLILASILGDGCFDISTSGGVRMGFAHSLKQLEYCKYKHNIFSNYNLAGKFSINRIKNKRYKEGFFEECRFKTNTHDIFKEYYNLYFLDKKRTILNIKKEDFNERVFALWYFDDGHICSASYQITCESLSVQEVEHLIKLIKESFDVVCNYDINNNIYITKASIPKFNSILINNLPNQEMIYKIRGSV